MGRGKNKKNEMRNSYVPWLAGGVIAMFLGLYCIQPKPEEVPKAEAKPPLRALMVHDGIKLEVFAAEEAGKYSGLELTLEQYKSAQFAQYAPVWCEIPNLKYSSPLPVQDGMKSARLTLGNSPGTIGDTLFIYGRDPMGKAVKLYETQIGGAK